MQLCTAVVAFMGFHFWANNRISYLKDNKNLSTNHSQENLNFMIYILEIYDITWLIIYITYIILFLVLPCRAIVQHQLPVASSLVVLLEQVRK
jgi:hypothetical protein